jgi:hypothetical protein
VFVGLGALPEDTFNPFVAHDCCNEVAGHVHLMHRPMHWHRASSPADQGNLASLPLAPDEMLGDHITIFDWTAHPAQAQAVTVALDVGHTLSKLPNVRAATPGHHDVGPQRPQRRPQNGSYVPPAALECPESPGTRRHLEQAHITTQLRRCKLSYQASYPLRRRCMLLPHLGTSPVPALARATGLAPTCPLYLYPALATGLAPTCPLTQLKFKIGLLLSYKSDRNL